MIISDLKHMEEIVSSRKDLEWDGWDVIKYTENAASYMSVDGVFRDGAWHKRQVYSIEESGWNVPNNFGRNNA